MTGGRPKDFDRDEVLQKAIDVFWEQGYQATSIDDLLTRMGIGRQSLYNTFGDKETLFREAIDRYHESVSEKMLSCLRVEGSPLQNIRNLFTYLVEHAGGENSNGCLIVNTAIEFAGLDRESEVLTAVRRVYGSMEKSLKKTLQQAVDAGELPTDYDVTSQGTFLAGSIQGIMLMAKTGATLKTLKQMANGVMMTLR